VNRLVVCLAPLLLAAGAAQAQDHRGHHPAPAHPPAPPPPAESRPTTEADPHAHHHAESPPATAEDAQAPADTADPHAGHVMPAPAPAGSADQDHAGHGAPPDPHAGHAMADPHAGHGAPAASGPPNIPTSADDPGRPPQPPPPPAALGGPAHAADAIWGAGTMADARAMLRAETGAMTTTAVVIDRLEAWSGDGAEGWLWDMGGWHGGDIHRFWWKSEGGGDFHGSASGEVQALYSRAVRPFWDVQAGVRQDFGDGPDTTHLVLGVQGLAPYWWEVDAAAFLSTRGDLAARVEAEYDLRITQRLVLQPRLEVEASASDVPERGLGSGLTHVEAGLRLRYEFVREFAPYVGVEWSRHLGRTADLARARGDDPEAVRWVVGVKAWF
jgi:copper resistance protein B